MTIFQILAKDRPFAHHLRIGDKLLLESEKK